ncbi:hypothetical protein [Erythrobacter aureus]|uniref:Uncharacterized protein n=1 Tax=Erythrobacter aureus TaxID=2182384 RepID=A0A345YIX7_9SPHN|nr:hypothetical protein [Erythrobacter aureus]AXK43879.1 hypothetical protein DVR09_15605 [Erythrobacter aureus]
MVIRPGLRRGLSAAKAAKRPALNAVAVSDLPFPEWEDTDLHDNSENFALFRQAAELIDGKGIFDFFVYRRVGSGPIADEELLTNVTAYYRDGKLSWVEGTDDGTLWTDK